MSDRRLAQIFHSLKQRRTDDTKKAQCFQAYWTQNSGSRKTAHQNTLSKTKTSTCAVLLSSPHGVTPAKALILPVTHILTRA